MPDGTRNLSSKFIDLNYAFGRLRYYHAGLSDLLLLTVGRLMVASITFPIRVGEMAVFARKHPVAENPPLV